MDNFVLTRKDMAILREFGHNRSEYKQITECANMCVYRDGDGHTISYKDAIDILGRENFLSGISRAAFHWTCSRETNGVWISFDCSDFFKQL